MNIYKKLLEVKKKVPYLKKDKKGYNYNYATPSQVFGVINPILNDLGLLLITNVIESKSMPITITTKNGDKTEWKYDLDFVFDWIDIEDGEKLSIPWKASGVNGEDKGLGSALTYAERYFILKQFNIPTDDDDPDNFQAKHMSEEDKKSLVLEKELQEAELKQRNLNTYIAKLAGCKTVDELKALKKTLPEWVKLEIQFSSAATSRFTEITSPKKQMQPA